MWQMMRELGVTTTLDRVGTVQVLARAADEEGGDGEAIAQMLARILQTLIARIAETERIMTTTGMRRCEPTYYPHGVVTSNEFISRPSQSYRRRTSLLLLS
jgi:G:T/U-mismatch repair DNA glycosylase